MLVEDLEKVLNELAPVALAEPWDNVGLLVGRRSTTVERVLVALELTEAVVVEAVTGAFQAIVTHHPLMFAPMRRITDRDRRGTLVSQLIAADVALFACHTNLDGAVGGLCDIVARELGLVEPAPLVRAAAGWKKLVGFVPADALEKVSRAVFAAGAGRIGDYEECAFQTTGEGTFLPGFSARPQVGRPGRLERVNEIRWETVVPSGRVPMAIEAYLLAHPYEEPVFDIYALEDVSIRGGQGRVGATRTSVSLVSFAEEVARVLGLESIAYAGSSDMRLDRVAVVTGSGGSFMEAAAGVADALVTGDLRYHDAERAQDLGLGLVMVPHGHVEAWALRRWVGTLRRALADPEVEVRFSQAARSPWQRVKPMPVSNNGGELVSLFDVEQATGVHTKPAMSAGAQDAVEPSPTYILRTDGGSRGNPGPSAIGVVLENEQGEVVEQLGDRIGTATNNQAEYQALLTGLETALDRGVRRLRIACDSELVVRQLRQEYKVRNAELRELYLQVRSLIQQFERVEIMHVPREENTAADFLVNQALDGRI
ncbi:MAG: Nif3-like dinuclear metal center hexameric protein [Thermoleophilia bacterium]|nr:Nif3-like dinuclear metal center hexameric protein [Thermoleophilia bacterium]